MMSYPIAISQHGQQFHAEVPDLPTIQITGDSIIDTIAQARHLITEHLQQLVNDNHTAIPTPQTISTHLTDGTYAGRTWAIVHVDAQNFTSITPPVIVRLPHSLHQKILTHLGQDPTLISQAELERFVVDAVLQRIETP